VQVSSGLDHPIIPFVVAVDRAASHRSRGDDVNAVRKRIAADGETVLKLADELTRAIDQRNAGAQWCRFSGVAVREENLAEGATAGAEKHDQARTMGPGEAVRAGASYIVVGRPIVAAADPRSAAEAIARELGAG